MNEEDCRILLDHKAVHQQTLLHRVNLTKMNIVVVMISEIPPVREKMSACNTPLEIMRLFKHYFHIKGDEPFLLRMHIYQLAEVSICDFLNS